MPHRRRDTLPRTTKRQVASQSTERRLVPRRPPESRRRRISRREREARQRRQLYWGLGAATALVVAILTFSALNEYIFKPRAVVASVGEVDIRRRDYWKVRSVDLMNQINQYQQFAQIVDQSQQQQYLQLAQQASEELDEVWGSTNLDETTLNRMIEDQIYLQRMDELGIEVTEQDIDLYINTQFQPSEAPIQTPTPTPTLIPQRAEWATQTVVAEEAALDPDGATMTALASTPVASPIGDASPAVDGSPEHLATPLSDASPVVDGSPTVVVASPAGGTPLASPVGASPVSVTTGVDEPASPQVTPDVEVVLSPADASPEGASPVGSPESASPASSPAASPGASLDVSPSGSPIASPVSGSPEATPIAPTEAPVSPTPNPTEAIQTAQANYEQYQDVVFEQANLSEEDYIRLIARPAVAREKVRELLTRDVGQTAEQVRASHILVDTKDLADAIYAQLQEPGADFEQIARDQSNDTSTAPNAGDLGWFTRGQMVEPFEEVAFSLAPGTFSQPVQTEFGWHIIRVDEKDPARALTDQQLEQYKENIVNRWLSEQREVLDISSDIEPTPTPAVSNFVPPPDAPPLPTPTPEPTLPPVEIATPVASPVASPLAEPVGSPPGSPGAILLATPIADGAGTPLASPVEPSVSPVPGSPEAATPIVEIPIASPVTVTLVPATPIVSPVASPAIDSSPVGTEVATPLLVVTPVATPATPIASPVASPVSSPSPTATPTVAVTPLIVIETPTPMTP